MAPEFGAQTTGDEVVAAFPKAVKDKIFVVTGASAGGLGAETVLSLAKGKPRQVILIGRDELKAQPVIDEVKRISPTTVVSFCHADFANLPSVRQGAAQVGRATDHIDCLINNAAIMACDQSRSKDGFELQMATNHLAPFVLTNALTNLMSPGGRVVNVSSLGHRYSDIHWDDVQLESPGAYSPEGAYGQSKTANILHAIELNKRLKPRGVTAYSLHPGSIWTNLARHMNEDKMDRMMNGMKTIDPTFEFKLKNLQEGCSTQLRLALDPALTDFSGSYFEDCQPAKRVEPYAIDEKAAAKFWELSQNLTNQTTTATAA